MIRDTQRQVKKKRQKKSEREKDKYGLGFVNCKYVNSRGERKSELKIQIIFTEICEYNFTKEVEN